jgi:hypothetical protein
MSVLKWEEPLREINHLARKAAALERSPDNLQVISRSDPASGCCLPAGPNNNSEEREPARTTIRAETETMAELANMASPTSDPPAPSLSLSDTSELVKMAETRRPPDPPS